MRLASSAAVVPVPIRDLASVETRSTLSGRPRGPASSEVGGAPIPERPAATTSVLAGGLTGRLGAASGAPAGAAAVPAGAAAEPGAVPTSGAGGAVVRAAT